MNQYFVIRLCLSFFIVWGGGDRVFSGGLLRGRRGFSHRQLRMIRILLQSLRRGSGKFYLDTTKIIRPSGDKTFNERFSMMFGIKRRIPEHNWTALQK